MSLRIRPRAVTITAGLSAVLVLTLTVIFTGCESLSRSRARSRYPHVLLVSIDTLHVGWTGPYNPDVRNTPFLDRFAREGTRFARAYTPVPITLPSHASLLTGRSPHRLGVLANGHVLPESAQTLAEILRDAGYRTGAFISLGVLGRAFQLDQGFDHYHDPFLEGSARWYRRADEVFGPFSSWLEEHLDEPTFAWLHLSDPHEPYLPVDAPPDTELRLDGELIDSIHLVGMEIHELSLELSPGEHRLEWRSLRRPQPDDRPETGIYLSIFDQDALRPFSGGPLPSASEAIRLQPSFELSLQNPGSVPAELSLSFSGRLVRPAPSDVLTNYEKEVAYVDRYLGEVQGELERLGIAEETLWIVVSDHGEGLFRHDLLGHARYAYEDQLRVLWLMRGPGIPAGKTLAEGPALLMDVAPTLIEMLGLTAPDMEGRSWASCLGDGPCPEPVPWWAFGLDHEANRPTAMAGYRWPYKWIWRRGQGRSGYQLTADPWEADNLLAVPGPHHPDALKRLAESFQAERRALNELLKAAAPSNLTEEEEELLRSLGYLGGPER